MLTALIVTDGLSQIMLTPETEADTIAIALLTREHLNIQVHRYSGLIECQAGYLRDYPGQPETSVVITFRKPTPDPL